MKRNYVTFSSSTIREVGVEICIIGQIAVTDVRLGISYAEYIAAK
jgi:hypothetical protein